jgi:hypothetical protein
MIVVGRSNLSHSPPFVTYALMAINAAVFLYEKRLSSRPPGAPSTAHGGL